MLKKKTKMKEKLDERFNGPFEILIVGKNSVKLKIKEKGAWFNIKNIKPFKRGDDVVVPSSPTF